MVTLAAGAAPPLIVIDGSQRVVAHRLRATISAMRADGWTVIHGWAAPLGREPVICAGTIATADDARRALLAAISGAGLALGLRADRDTTDRLLDDLRRLGPVTHLGGARPPGELVRLLLTPQQRALLAMMGEGLSVAEAGLSLGLTRASAGRRLAAARTALGADSTAAAIVAVLAAGIDRRSHHGPHVRASRWPRRSEAARANGPGDRGRGPA
jgi:hypothetical protein